ncbi:MAG TPA: response regulator [Actinomycetota bacterium]|nr:response regulator [Actinomycetota bacterium]
MSSVEDGSGLVLVVDDDLVALELALDVLGSAGYTVSGASTVAEAVDVARGSRPGLVVLDLNLGEEDGLELVDRLRTDPGLREVPVVVWSASTSPQDLDRISAAGCDAFLGKPLSPQRFLDGVGAYVRPPRERRH